MNIQTGRGTIPLVTLLAIWSISLVVNLPGLAITPILSNIEHIFPHASQLEVQLLTILPNLFIIPFVLLAGRLSVSKDKITILVTALLIYLGSGLLYFFAQSMTDLIIISSLLGVGCGLLIPLAAGLLADFFVGKYRMQQLGIKSGIANISLVLATFVVGGLSDKNWHLSFLVYLLPIVPLLFTPFLRGDRGKAPVSANSPETPPVENSLNRSKLWGLMGLYGFITYAAIVISYYLPFLVGQYKISTSTLGTITALFFLAVMLPGFILPWIVRTLKQNTSVVMLLLIALGLGLIVIAHHSWLFGVGALCIGFGYGTFQPIIYDKATEAATGNKATLALSIVLAVNYFSVTMTPFVVDFFRFVFNDKSAHFPFLFNLVLALGAALFAIVKRKSNTFSMNQNYV